MGNSTLRVYGKQNNTAQYGGGIAALECLLVLAGNLLLENNRANFGGGLYVDQSRVNGYATFSNNFANADGGGIYASRSLFYMNRDITFFQNSALNGGGLLLTEDSKLYIQPNTTINSTNNLVKQRGGAIKVEKYNPLSYCVEVSCAPLIGSDCFFQIDTNNTYDINNISRISELQNIRIYFNNNTAFEAGAALYGGLVDNCTLNFINPQLQDVIQLYKCPNSGEVFDYITNSDNQSPDISSDPL